MLRYEPSLTRGLAPRKCFTQRRKPAKKRSQKLKSLIRPKIYSAPARRVMLTRENPLPLTDLRRRDRLHRGYL